MKMVGLGGMNKAINEQQRKIKRRQIDSPWSNGKGYTIRYPPQGSGHKDKSRHSDNSMDGQSNFNNLMLNVLNFAVQSLLSQQNVNGHRSPYGSDAHGRALGSGDLIDVLQNLGHSRAPHGSDRNALRGIPDDELEDIRDQLIREVRDRERHREGGHRNRSYSRNRNGHDRHGDLQDILGGMYAEYNSQSRSSSPSSSDPYRPPYRPPYYHP